MKDHQLKNEPGGEIKEKTRRSGHCYRQKAKLKLQGDEYGLFCSCCLTIGSSERQTCCSQAVKTLFFIDVSALNSTCFCANQDI